MATNYLFSLWNLISFPSQYLGYFTEGKGEKLKNFKKISSAFKTIFVFQGNDRAVRTPKNTSTGKKFNNKTWKIQTQNNVMVFCYMVSKNMVQKMSNYQEEINKLGRYNFF